MNESSGLNLVEIKQIPLNMLKLEDLKLLYNSRLNEYYKHHHTFDPEEDLTISQLEVCEEKYIRLTEAVDQVLQCIRRIDNNISSNDVLQGFSNE